MNERLNNKKKSLIIQMFNNVARHYDFLNHFLSFNIDKYWRRRVVREIQKCFIQQEKDSLQILDIATGTGDMAICLSKIKKAKIIGIDLSEKMLDIAKRKILKKGLNSNIKIFKVDAEKLPFPDREFDIVTIAFGIRNFENLDKALKEIIRVLKSDGICIILEFSIPQKFLFKKIYFLYFKYILPFLGNILSKDRYAYSYLVASVSKFPVQHKFIEILERNGFNNVSYFTMTFGITSLYIAKK